jgi:phosphoglycolate phosphatase-like HAD superfamily hydrolase
MPPSPDLEGVLILWDIDGTLIEHAPNKRDRHAFAVEQVLGEVLEALPAGLGKTDRQIVIELLSSRVDPSLRQIDQALELLDSITDGDLQSAPTQAIAGIPELLQHMTRWGIANTVLTGNTPRRAHLKTSSAKIARHLQLEFGFFGNKHSNRHDLVAEAAAVLAERRNRAVIVGDTPLDVYAAQASGIPVIAAATGIYSVDELQRCQPDAVLADFRDINETFADLISSAIGS